MKRKLSIAVLVLFVVAGVFAIYRFGFRKSLPDSDINLQVVAVLQQNGCLECHSQSAPEPFYGDVPVIGTQIKAHMANGTKYIDLDPVVKALTNGTLVNEVDLAKIEQTVYNGTMPIAMYKMAHWGTGYNKEEKSVITSWAKEVRAKNFATNLSAPEFANEPVQPLVDAVPTDSAKVALGFKLYHDGRLSADGTISCATCHGLTTGGVDGTTTSKGIYGQMGPINAPTVYNAVFNVEQFWDGRAKDLQAQAGGPPTNPLEMGHASWDDIVALIASDKDMVKTFAAIYDNGVTADNITDAIAEFEKTLITPNSPFDLYLKGNSNAISEDEKMGYELFKQYNCATCHVGQAMGGQSFEIMGAAQPSYFKDRASKGSEFTDTDFGRYGVTGLELDKSKFKTPTLRNIALTAPYLHDGSAITLDEAVDAMFKYQVNRSYTQQDVELIVKFMNTLTGQNKYM